MGGRGQRRWRIPREKLRRENSLLLQLNTAKNSLEISSKASLETPSDRFKGLKAIASVAWLWFNIVKGSPGLWAVLDSRTPAEVLPTFFKRPGDLPFTVMMHRPALNSNLYLGECIGGSELNNGPFLDMVLPTLGRWREASLILQIGRTNFAKTLEILARPAPLLKMFHLKSEVVVWGSQIDLFQGHAADLTEMTVQGLPVRWGSGIFHKLLSVRIMGVWKSGPTAEEVLRSLLASPLLRYFQLSGTALSPSTTRQDILPVEIPHLTSLDLSDIPLSSTQFILSRTRAPALRRLVVRPNGTEVTDRDHVPTFFRTSLLHFGPTIYSSIAHASGLNIIIWASAGTISISTIGDPGSNWGISISFHHRPIFQGLQVCLGLLLQNVPVLPPISLFVCSLDNVPESDLLWIFDSEINDKVAEIVTSGSKYDSFLPFLCIGRALGGVVKWPLPKLKRLSLPPADDVSGERLVRLLRQRYAPDLGKITGAHTSDPQILEAPDRLTLLDVGDAAVSLADYDNLADILGPDIVQRCAK